MGNYTVSVSYSEVNQRNQDSRPLSINILPPDKISQFPLLFAIHGTSADAAIRIANEHKPKLVLPRLWPNDDGFYAYLCCREHPPRYGGAAATEPAAVSRTVFMASALATYYASLRCGFELEDGKIERGMGLVLLQITPEDFDLWELDKKLPSRPLPNLGPISVSLPESAFGAQELRILGTVVSDEEINTTLERLVRPYNTSHLAKMVLFELRQYKHLIGPQWLSVDDIKDAEIKKSVRKNLDLLPFVDRLVQIFIRHVTEILSCRPQEQLSS